MVHSQIWVMLHSVYAWRGLEPTSLPCRSRLALALLLAHRMGMAVCRCVAVPRSRPGAPESGATRRPKRGGRRAAAEHLRIADPDDLGTMCV